MKKDMTPKQIEKLEERYVTGKLMEPGASRKNGENLGRLLAWKWEYWKATHASGFDGYASSDGSALQGIRWRIHKMRLDVEKWCEPCDYPEEYSRGLPPEVPVDYMAQVETIIPEVREAFSRVEASPAYQRLESMCRMMSDEDACIIAGYNNPKKARAQITIALTHFDKLRRELESIEQDTEHTPEEWAGIHAQALFSLRRYARLSDWHIQNMQGHYEHNVHAMKAHAAGKTDCRGYRGTWCENCDVCGEEAR